MKAGPLSKYYPSVDIFEKTGNSRDDQNDLAQHWEWKVATADVRLMRPFRANQQETDAVIAFLEGKPDQNFLIDPTFVKTWLENQPVQVIQR